MMISMVTYHGWMQVQAGEMIALFAQENQLALSSEAARLLYAELSGTQGVFSVTSAHAV